MRTQERLGHSIDEAKRSIAIDGEYVHFKNPSMRYRVVAIVINVDSEDPWVVYQALYGDRLLFTRSVAEWSESVTRDGKKFQRFTRV